MSFKTTLNLKGGITLMTTKNKWIAVGDVNPMEHGGVWTQKESDTIFRIVRIDKTCNENEWFVQTGYIDISDEWINKKSVMDYAGITEETFEPMNYAESCFWFYSYEEFQGTEKLITGLGNAKKEIRAHGIVIPNGRK